MYVNVIMVRTQHMCIIHQLTATEHNPQQQQNWKKLPPVKTNTISRPLDLRKHLAFKRIVFISHAHTHKNQMEVQFSGRYSVYVMLRLHSKKKIKCTSDKSRVGKWCYFMMFIPRSIMVILTERLLIYGMVVLRYF